jgi:hypothetical protein
MTLRTSRLLLVLGLMFCNFIPPLSAQEKTKVERMRVPNRGIQPQVVTDARGDVHLLYFQGEPGGGDLFYVRTRNQDGKFTAPIKVNDVVGSAMAIGNIRGGQLALGKNGRVHVSWLGSSKAKLKDPANATGMFYTRLDDAGTAFEPQRNIIQESFGLDGGGSVAADKDGNVYVAWHAPAPGTKGENNRAVWIAKSSDEGKTFLKETKANSEPTGACGCCGMRAFVDSKGTLSMLYRSAFESIHRDIQLLHLKSPVARMQNAKLQQQEIATCPMSTFSFAETTSGILAAWDNEGQVFFTRIDPATGKVDAAKAAPGDGKNRKHPVLAGNSKGETIFVWTEGMGWNRGGSLAWQVYDKAGNAVGERGSAEGVPVWSLVGAFARPDGTFVILY